MGGRMNISLTGQPSQITACSKQCFKMQYCAPIPNFNDCTTRTAPKGLRRCVALFHELVATNHAQLDVMIHWCDHQYCTCTLRCLCSYLWICTRPPPEQTHRSMSQDEALQRADQPMFVLHCRVHQKPLELELVFPSRLSCFRCFEHNIKAYTRNNWNSAQCPPINNNTRVIWQYEWFLLRLLSELIRLISYTLRWVMHCGMDHVIASPVNTYMRKSVYNTI